MLLIPTFASEMSGVLSKLLDEQFLPLVACDNTPANSFFKNGGFFANSSVSKLLILVFGARRIPSRRARACNTFKEPAGGLWGILN